MHDEKVFRTIASTPGPEDSRPDAAANGFWRSRGYLPHFERDGLVQTVTFCLADSIPAPVLQEWRDRLDLQRRLRQPEQTIKQEFQLRIQRYLDAGRGECCLSRPDAAGIVEEALLYFDGVRYRLLAWVIMPNHVHLVVEIFAGYPLYRIVHSWKSFTASKVNKQLGKKGSLWRREYYDRFVRNERHLEDAIDYVHGNPAKAGLVGKAEDWRFSSAWKGLGG